MKTLAGAARYFILFAVVGAMLAAITVLVYGFLEALQLVWLTVEEGVVTRKGAKVLVLEFIEIIDLFLLGTVFFVISIGLYELFIDTDIPVPAWLQIKTLDDLKTKLIGVVIVVLAVLFLGQIMSWDGETDLLGYGAAIALVIAALAYFLGSKTGK